MPTYNFRVRIVSKDNLHIEAESKEKAEDKLSEEAELAITGELVNIEVISVEMEEE